MKTARQKADTELVRRQNRSLVLETLRQYGPLASIELGEKTGLSPATISAITNDMLNERLIENDRNETEKHRQVQRGRPKIKLRLAADAAAVLGVQLTHNQINLLIADFNGAVRQRTSVSMKTAHLEAEDIGRSLKEEITTFLETSDTDAGQISVASIACQGSVDADKGEIIWSPAYDAKNIPIAAPIEKAFNIPCVVANDTNTIAHGLNAEDETLGGSFAVLYLSSGIGLGLFVNGSLLEGSDGSASEFGHMPWQQDGAMCRCGRKGCVEAYASDFGIYRSAHPGLSATDPADIVPDKAEMIALAEKARAGDPVTLKAFAKAGEAMGFGLCNLIMLVNPRQILFTGPGLSYLDLIKPSMDQALTHVAGRAVSDRMRPIDDDRDLIEVGLLSLAFVYLDRDVFAKRVSVEAVAARQKLAIS